MNSLRLGGYSLKFKTELLNGILKRREHVDPVILEKGLPKYRNREDREI